MTEDDLDESFYARGVPLDRGSSLGPEAPTEYNRRVKIKTVQHSVGRSAVHDNCYGRLSVNIQTHTHIFWIYFLWSFALKSIHTYDL